ncbi:hypothetical protein PR048_008079 [Dryococelus australis]|uniref:Uncharacterized protein n=1 Tax=Dryococelus australis TaxID=614101 RepID=A0ABQ9HW22_9NEOP|nr:hypothetical protein PR048_008079 [Dryococelus australis]
MDLYNWWLISFIRRKNKHDGRSAGDYWFRGFLTRYPELNISKGEAHSSQKMYKDKNIGANDDGLVFNCAETDFSQDPKDMNIVAAKVIRRIHGTLQELEKIIQQYFPFPPNDSHIIQPLDKTVFKYMKTDWNQLLLVHYRKSPGKILIKAQFAEQLTTLWGESFKSRNLRQALSLSNAVTLVSTAHNGCEEIPGPRHRLAETGNAYLGHIEKPFEQIEMNEGNEQFGGRGKKVLQGAGEIITSNIVAKRLKEEEEAKNKAKVLKSQKQNLCNKHVTGLANEKKPPVFEKERISEDGTDLDVKVVNSDGGELVELEESEKQTEENTFEAEKYFAVDYDKPSTLAA